MLLRSAILLYFLSILPICPSQFCDRIGTGSYEESTQASGSQSTTSSKSTEKRLENTHLWIHTKPPKALNASKGDSKYLKCMAEGRPTPTIHWLKDGIIKQGETPDVYHQHLPFTDPPRPNRRIEDGFTVSWLYLDCLSVEDQGNYTCVAENPYHRLEASTNLMVIASEEIQCGKSYHGEVPRINLWTETMIAYEGNEIKFICRANGDPTPTIKWLGLGKVELTDAGSDKYEFLSNGDLVVRNLSWSDMGHYTCTAENDHGETRVEVFLYPTVLAKGQLRPRRLGFHVIPPEALDITEGDSKYLVCMAEGKPEPTIHWLKDGIRITQGEAFDEYHRNFSSTTDPMIIERNNIVSFTISWLYLDCVSVKDQGEYTCVAENTYSLISASTNLAVLSSDEEIECEKSYGGLARINLLTKTKIAFEGQDIKFFCRANGDPTPTVRWLGLMKEQLMNDDSDKYEVLPNGDLVVRNLSWSDMGHYTCIAENDHGEHRVQVFLYPTVDDF